MTNSNGIDELRTEVEKIRLEFPTDAYQMFAAGLVINSVDYADIKRDNILDGPDDKKIDFSWLDRTQRRAIIAQGTERVDWKDEAPSANKASDLNTALTWLFDSDPSEIARPDIRAAAEEFRSAIQDGDLQEIELYYFHNSSPAVNVATELKAVLANLTAKVKALPAPADEILCSAEQVDRANAAERLRARYSAIAIKDDVPIRLAADVQEVKGTGWAALIGPVHAPVLVDLVRNYGAALYTPNIRDYLGARRSAHNINQQIRATATTDPDHFWVFNNGVTFVTRHAVIDSPTDIHCQGIGVTNGAQTIGSLYQAAEEGADLSKVLVQARFISTDAASVIDDIIRYNNTQNPIFSWEQRVHDPVQARLQVDFTGLGIAYVARRGQGQGGAGAVELALLAPWLAAFHGDPGAAHRNSRDLFEDDSRYNELFNRFTSVRHLLLVYRFGETISVLKDELKARIEDGTATNEEIREYGYFRYAAFRYALIDMSAELLVTLGGGAADLRERFVLGDALQGDRVAAIKSLKTIVQFALRSSREHLSNVDSPSEQFRTQAGISALRGATRQAVTLIQTVSPDAVNPLADGIEVLK